MRTFGEPRKLKAICITGKLTLLLKKACRSYTVLAFNACYNLCMRKEYVYEWVQELTSSLFSWNVRGNVCIEVIYILCNLLCHSYSQKESLNESILSPKKGRTRLTALARPIEGTFFPLWEIVSAPSIYYSLTANWVCDFPSWLDLYYWCTN